MKKIITILLALTLMLSVMPMALSTSAEGNVISVTDCETFKSAVESAVDGDTIQLANDIELSPSTDNQDYSTITLAKNITLDTNGFVLKCGSMTTNKPKASVFTVQEDYTLTVTNSKRTEQVTDSDDFDIICNATGKTGVFKVNSGAKTTIGANLICKNINIKDVNQNTNNTPGVIDVHPNTRITTPANVTLENCYFDSNMFTALRLQENSLVNLSASNCVFGGKLASVCTIAQNTNSNLSNLTFNNCTFKSPITVSINANVANMGDSNLSTSSVSSLNFTFNNCTGTEIYGYDLNAKFVGNNKFDKVCEKVVVSADESTGLYSDDTYETALTSGALTADTPVYTKLLSAETDGTTTTALSTDSKASIRLGTVSGIRFYTTFNVDAIEGTVVEKGTLIGPKDKIGDYLTIEDTVIPYGAEVGNAVAVKYEADTLWKNNEFVGSIVGIQEKNYNRAFTARAYVKLSDGTYLYSATTTTKTVADIADAFIADATKEGANANDVALYNAHKELVDAWAAAN